MDHEISFIAKLSWPTKTGFKRGTAVLVSPTHALTCTHVLKGASAKASITLEFPGLTVTGTSPVRLRDEKNDLALIEFAPAHPGPVPAWTARIEVDSKVRVAGWPWGEFAREQEWKHGPCTVSSVNTLDTQLHISLNHGASGGAILDAHGHCAGLLNLAHKQFDHSKAIPAHTVHEFLTRHGIQHSFNPKPTHLDHAERYRQHLRDRTCRVDLGNLLAERGKREIPRLDEFYATLTTRVIVPNKRPKGRTTNPLQPEEAQRIPLQSLLQQHRRILLRGEAGSGKTTFLRRIAWALCRENPQEDSLKLPFSGLPLLVRVRDLDNYIEKAIDRKETPDLRPDPLWIGHFLAGQVSGIEPEFFQRQLGDRNCVLLIDGLDEAAGSARRQQIASLVQQALPHNGCACVVTTRPVVGNDTAPLSDLVPAEIDPLTSDAIHTFLKNWCLWYEEGQRENLDSYFPNLQRAVSRPELEPLAGNPLMLTLMAIVCQIKQKQLPERRADVYKEVVDYLADLSERRDAEARPDHRAQFNARRDTVPRLITLARKMQTGEKPFTGHTIRVTESQASQALEDKFISPSEATDFILFAQRDSGILTLRGEQLEFWHRSFQEYLVGRHVAERREWPLAARLLFDTESRDVLVLAAGCVAERDDLEDLFQRLFIEIEGKSLNQRAIAAGVLHQMRFVLDQSYLERTATRPQYEALLASLEPIFTQSEIPGLSIAERVQAAEAIGAAHPFMTIPDQESYWVAIGGGDYIIGLTKEEEKRFEVKAPRRTGAVRPFSIGRYPVTVREYEGFLADPTAKVERPRGWGGQLNHPAWPVTGVSWSDANLYCEWATERYPPSAGQPDRRIRLPEEHEWEIAARGLRAERQYPWPDGEPSPEKANSRETGIRQEPTPVGIFPAGNTPEGAADMAGNVWEWTASEYDKEGRRVVRGGAFDGNAGYLRSAVRDWSEPVGRYNDLGFRCLRESLPL